MLTADFVDTEVDLPASNGRVLAYLSAHADIYHQEFHDNRVKLNCYLPRHLVHHIQEPDVHIRLRGSNGEAVSEA
jgi:GTP-binding protein HflX